MILKQLIENENNIHNPDSDMSINNVNDTRKTRLTLEQINKLRMLADSKLAEYHEKISSVKKQYSPPKEDSATI
jgi:hypothetical protein